MQEAVPAGFEPLPRSSPFLDRTGPYFSRGRGNGFSLGLRVAEHHLNARGLVHGGVLMTMADIALGYSMATSLQHPPALVTASLSADFAGSARLNDWIETRAEIQKIGRTLAFANIYICLGELRIVRASGVFAVPASTNTPAST
jgi:acyl-coenzyme A thioesterase 13